MSRAMTVTRMPFVKSLPAGEFQCAICLKVFRKKYTKTSLHNRLCKQALLNGRLYNEKALNTSTGVERQVLLFYQTIANEVAESRQLLTAAQTKYTWGKTTTKDGWTSTMKSRIRLAV